MSLVLTPEGTPASPVEGEVYYDSSADKLKGEDSEFREVVSKNSSGEIDGTLSSSAVVPASGLKLTASYSGNLNGNTPAYLVNGAFSSTYDSYLVMMHGQLSSDLDAESTLNMRLSKSNNTNSNNSCWSIVRGWDHNGTGRSTTRSNQDSLYIVNGVDKTYPWGITFKIDRPGTSNHTFMQGTSCNFRDVDGLFAQAFSGFHGTNYSATGFAFWWSVSGTQSTFNINIYGIDG